MTASPKHAVPVLSVPTGLGSLVFPNAMVCEVIAKTDIHPVPGTRVWVLGYCLWRGVPVSVVSIDMLLGIASTHDNVRKIVVMYPLPGRNSYDYYAIATHADPRSLYIERAVETAAGSTGLRRHYVASLLALPQGLGIVLDFEALKATFYSH